MSLWNSLFGTIEPTVKYCENAVSGVIARPGYFISNLPFILLGIWLLFKKDRLSKVFGLFSIGIGLASSIYDASFRYNAQIIDLKMMFAFINFLIILNLNSLFKLSKARSIALFIILQLIYGVLLITLKGGIGSLLFGIAVAALIGMQFWIWKLNSNSEKMFWSIAFIVFILGWLIWQFDANQIWCDPSTLFNGRAVFHYLTTVAIYFLWRHYNADVNKSILA